MSSKFFVKSSHETVKSNLFYGKSNINVMWITTELTLLRRTNLEKWRISRLRWTNLCTISECTCYYQFNQKNFNRHIFNFSNAFRILWDIWSSISAGISLAYKTFLGRLAASFLVSLWVTFLLILTIQVYGFETGK